MGGSSSKESSEVLRNRRLKEFEEELEIHDDGANSSRVTSPPLRDSYFEQFINEGSLRSSDLKVLRDGNNLEEDLDLDTISIGSRISKGNISSSSTKDKDSEVEVDEVIAELEETFKTLKTDESDNESGKLSPSLREFSRSQSCGPLTQGMPLGINQGPVDSPVGDKSERRGTPMTGVSYGYNRQRRPLGLAHLSRSSGGLLGASGNDLKGASSAPPGTNIREPSIPWEPPKIEGFDIEKFREANRPLNESPITISVRLPSSSDDDGKRSSTKNPEKLSASYTNDEMELFRTLEREVF